MANTLWAYAKADVAALTLFEAVARETMRRGVGELSVQTMARVVWAFSTSGVSASFLFAAIADEATGRVREFNAQDMSNTVLAFATASAAAPGLFQAIAVEASRRVGDFTVRELTNTLWAFACVGFAQTRVFTDLVSAIAERIDELNDFGKSQLHAVALYWRLTWPVLDFPLSAHLGSFRSAYVRFAPCPSQLQHDVSAMLLERLHWKHVFEHVTEEGLSLDLARPESKLAIEVDGPFHYLWDASSGDSVVNGGTRFKSTLLELLGWNVVRVSFTEWNGQSEKARRELLARKCAFLRL